MAAPDRFVADDFGPMVPPDPEVMREWMARQPMLGPDQVWIGTTRLSGQDLVRWLNRAVPVFRSTRPFVAPCRICARPVQFGHGPSLQRVCRARERRAEGEPDPTACQREAARDARRGSRG